MYPVEYDISDGGFQQTLNSDKSTEKSTYQTCLYSLPSVRGSADHASPPSQPESFHSFIFINTKNCESDDDKSQHKGT